MYLLHSNIWLCASDGPQNKVSCKDSEAKVENDKADPTVQTKATPILFESAVDVVNKQLKVQKQFIWDAVKAEQKQNDAVFQDLVAFGNDFEAMAELRQDKLLNGIVPETDEISLYGTIMNLTNSDSKYDLMFELNTKSYLTKCLQFAHANNGIFQKQMRQVFASYDNCHFESAPVE